MNDKDRLVVNEFVITLVLILLGIACLITANVLEVGRLRQDTEKYFLLEMQMQNCVNFGKKNCHLELDDDNTYNIYWED